MNACFARYPFRLLLQEKHRRVISRLANLVSSHWAVSHGTQTSDNGNTILLLQRQSYSQLSEWRPFSCRYENYYDKWRQLIWAILQRDGGVNLMMWWFHLFPLGDTHASGEKYKGHTTTLQKLTHLPLRYVRKTVPRCGDVDDLALVVKKFDVLHGCQF
jgi:hypothetical protein